MTSEPATTTARPTCKYPGCGQPAAPATGPGRPPEYCEGREHTKVTAWRERRRLAAVAAGTTAAADTDRPVTHARLTGAELLLSWHAEADRLAGIVGQLRDSIETLTDPTAAEAEVEAARTAAEQRATAAEAVRAAAEQRAAEADRFRAEADAAAEEMAVQLAAADRRAADAEAARAQAAADRDQTRADAHERVAAAEAERDTAIVRARAEANERVSAAEADRDQTRADAAQVEESAWLAQQEATRAQAAANAAREETGRVRADAEKMLDRFRTEAAAELAAVRTDLRARAERAEHEADAYRAELAQPRDQASPDEVTGSPAVRTPRRTREAAQP